MTPPNASSTKADNKLDLDVEHHCGIVLHPAGHTRSPAMHRAAYQALGLSAAYQAFDVPPKDLVRAIFQFRERGLRQFAVSIPHKETVMGLVDEVDPVGEAIGAINTVTRVDEKLVGTNTDWIGALKALERATPVRGQRAVILGAGGTARALLYALRQRDCEVFILNRTQERAARLADEFDAAGSAGLEAVAELAPQLLINTTSVGLGDSTSPISASALHEEMVVLDAVYSPERTQLIQDAEARGARTVGGKWMLVYQAVEQLRIWTRQLEKAPSDEAIGAIAETMASAFDEAGRLE